MLDTIRDDSQVNVRFLNSGEGSIKLYKGTTVGHVEQVTVFQEPEGQDDAVVRQMSSASPRSEDEHIIQRLVDESSLESPEEKERTVKLLMD